MPSNKGALRKVRWYKNTYVEIQVLPCRPEVHQKMVWKANPSQIVTEKKTCTSGDFPSVTKSYFMQRWNQESGRGLWLAEVLLCITQEEHGVMLQTAPLTQSFWIADAACKQVSCLFCLIHLITLVRSKEQVKVLQSLKTKANQGGITVQRTKNVTDRWKGSLTQVWVALLARLSSTEESVLLQLLEHFLLWNWSLLVGLG